MVSLSRLRNLRPLLDDTDYSFSREPYFRQFFDFRLGFHWNLCKGKSLSCPNFWSKSEKHPITYLQDFLVNVLFIFVE